VPTIVRTASRAHIHHGAPIDSYRPIELVLAQWIESEGMLRTEEELLAAMIQELGYKRRSRKIVAAVTAAIKQARKGK
jgi:hypothetical protein